MGEMRWQPASGRFDFSEGAERRERRDESEALEETQTGEKKKKNSAWFGRES